MNDPVAFTIMGLEIRWYAIIISLGMVLGVLLAQKRAKKYGYKSDDILDLVLFAIPAAIIGARIYYVIFEWDRYAGDFFAMINIRAGGLAIHGGVIGGIIAGYIISKKKGFKFNRILDLFAPSIILGQAIGRWGNFMNNEAHGGPTNLPWAIPVNGQMVHPTFLYESICDFLIFLFLIYYDKNRKKSDGEIFLLYGILYSIARFFIEGMRTDSLYVGGIRTAQLISVTIIFLFSIIFYVLRKKDRKKQ